MEKQFDLILHGATSFVGQIMTEYLSGYQGEGFSWAISGRNEKKLNDLKYRLDLDIEHFIADASDTKSLRSLCKHSKVIVSTVGPYALYGEPLIKACVETGTDYCDLTGEPQWIMSMLSKYEQQAKQSGARIINCAGFDSIPSDIGVFSLQQYAIKTTGQPAQQVKMRVRSLKGGASGGTIASMLNVMKEAKENPSLRKALVNPYVLCPQGHDFSVRQKNHSKAEKDDDLGIWTMPFVMAAINERIVHRTNALLDNRYGNDFRYDEAMSTKKASQAWTFTMGLGAFMVGASISPIRSLLEKHVLPKPGEGPTPDEQLKGSFDMRFYATLQSGEQVVFQVYGDRDPGYGSTAKMLAQATLCLANDVEQLKGGFWTPASALNDFLIERLAKHAGVTVKKLS